MDATLKTRKGCFTSPFTMSATTVSTEKTEIYKMSSSKKVLGILGGLGPLAGVYFYQLIT